MNILEKTFEVKPIGVRYICDVCNKGEMSQTGQLKMYEHHATFVHKCNNCKHELELNEKYPLIRYEQI